MSIQNLHLDSSAIEQVLDFWFAREHQSLWFRSTPEFDQQIKERFEPLWMRLNERLPKSWMQSPQACLAAVIVFDQFPLNMFRGQTLAFATESKAIKITKYAIKKQFDEKLTDQEVVFLYMPLMHSEKIEDQQASVECFTQRKLDSNLRFAKHHRDIIQRFGRFPHRNAILGRESSAKELEYLASNEAFLG